MHTEGTTLEITDIDRRWSHAIDAVAKDLAVERWQIEEAFAYGACATLALELVDRLGLPIFIAATEDGYMHAFCAVSEDRGLDIWGVRPFRVIKSVWAEDAPDVQLLRIPADDLRAMGGSPLESRYEGVPGVLASALSEIVMDNVPLRSIR